MKTLRNETNSIENNNFGKYKYTNIRIIMLFVFENPKNLPVVDHKHNFFMVLYLPAVGGNRNVEN